MGATTTKTRAYTCDRCMRSPTKDEPLNHPRFVYALPDGWKWKEAPPLRECYCPGCLPALKAFVEIESRWHQARNSLYDEATREAERAAEAKIDAWLAENPEPVAEWAADTAALRKIIEREATP